jgi:iron complex transport system permease protein
VAVFERRRVLVLVGAGVLAIRAIVASLAVGNLGIPAA